MYSICICIWSVLRHLPYRKRPLMDGMDGMFPPSLGSRARAEETYSSAITEYPLYFFPSSIKAFLCANKAAHSYTREIRRKEDTTKLNSVGCGAKLVKCITSSTPIRESKREPRASSILRQSLIWSFFHLLNIASGTTIQSKSGLMSS